MIGTVETTGAAHTPPKERVREAAHPEPESPASYGSPAGVYDSLEVAVPEIGDFADIPVIEVHVAVGDTVAAEDPLITLESDKATMDVPAPAAGTVTAVKVSVGDTVSVGTPIVDLSTGQAGTPARNRTHSPGPDSPDPRRGCGAAAAAVRAPAPYTGPKGDVHAEVLVLGAGPGGYTAAFRAADLGRKVVMVDSRGPLGGVCLNVGCIPSKALLHAAKVIAETKEMGGHGLSFAAPTIDLDALRSWKDGVVNRLTGGLDRAGQAAQGHHRRRHRHVHLPEHASGSRTGRQHVDGVVRAAIIAAGSEPVALPFVPHDDPRVIDSTGALELDDIPERLLVLGGGIIGLEMATVYSELGSRISVVELMDQLIPGADKDMVTPLDQADHQDATTHIWLSTKVTAVEAGPDGLTVSLRGREGPRDRGVRQGPRRGRPPPQRAGDRGRRRRRVRRRARVHPGRQAAAHQRRRTSSPSATSSGSRCSRTRPTHEGKVAAENTAGHTSYFDATVIPVGRLHRSRGRLGRRHRERGQGRRGQVRQGRVPVGRVRPVAVARAGTRA